jgi:23S rRNA (cytidine2498-2'-O)-methyltransferase
LEYIITYFPEFKKASYKEIKKADNAAVFKELEANISLITVTVGNEIFFDEIHKNPPIFIRHIMPVQRTGTITNNFFADKTALLNASLEISQIEAGSKFSVQCRIINGNLDYSCKDVEVFIGSHFDSMGGIPCFSDRTLSNEDVFVFSLLISGNTYYLGFSRSVENLSSHSDEYRLISRAGENEVSRAENKLKEAINKFNLSLTGPGLVLDMGASPGGWSKVLADMNYQVIAVDPGNLHPSVLSCTNIRHIKDRIENCRFDTPFVLLVNDMNIDPQQTAEIMVNNANKLVCGGIAIVTLKLPFSDINRSLEESINLLKQKYHIAAVKNLTHNRREVTVLLKKLEEI